MNMQSARSFNPAADSQTKAPPAVQREPESYYPVEAQPFGAFNIQPDGTALYLVAAYKILDWRTNALAEKPEFFLYQGRVGLDKKQIDEKDALQLGYAHDFWMDHPKVVHNATRDFPFVTKTQFYGKAFEKSTPVDVFAPHADRLDMGYYPSNYTDFRAAFRAARDKGPSVDLTDDYRDSRDPGAEYLAPARAAGRSCTLR